ncbi:MAG: AsmA-like C-terminal region-containing protein, partial [Pseudomonadota bacterium]
VDFTFGHDGENITHTELTGKFPEGGPIVAALRPSASAQADRDVVIRADDAGRVMRGLLAIDSLIGGELALDATIDDPDRVEAPAGAASAMQGRLRVSDFRVVRAPALAKLLGATSLSGLADVLNGDGIAFDKLSADFAFQDETFVLETGRAVGSSVGISASGPIDFAGDEMRINGALAPAYSINSAFGAAPVVGGIFAPREGEGLFGLTFSLSGPVEEPTIFVNPLSALAPGFLRRIFEPPPEPEDEAEVASETQPDQDAN